MRTAVVVGAGVGGIAAAARLARAGYQVTVFEKQAFPGGRLAVFERDGFHFDMGPSLFLMPPVFAETYHALGERMEEHLDLIRLDPTYRVHFHDDTTLDLTADLLLLRQAVEAIEPGSAAALLQFLAEGADCYYTSLSRFVGRNFYGWLQYFSPGNLPLLFRLKALVKHYSNTSRYFQDQRLRAAFSFQNMYLGLSPFDAPATFSLLQYTELGEGVWFPRGGMYRIGQSLASIAEGLGVQFHYQRPVVSIGVDGSQATGVSTADGEQVPADVVVANADLPYVYAELLPASRDLRALEAKKYTSSAIVFYWALDDEPSPLLLHHNVFLSDHRYRESFDRIFRDLTLPDEPSFYIHAPTRSDPSLAPPGCDSLMVLVPIGHISEEVPQDWEALKAKAREAVFARLARAGLPDVQRGLRFEAVMEPLKYLQDYNLAKGAAFGLSHSFTQVGYLRPRNRHKRYGNLYFVGASTHPGTGLPIVLLSAKLTTERILREQPSPV